jgi:hypothetical protein
VVCFRRFAARYPAEAAFVAVLFGLWLLLHAKMRNWPPAWSWGSRYFLTITPVLVLPACASWEWIKESLWRRSLLVCAVTSGAVLSASSTIGNFHFRWALAAAQGREQSMIWSLTGAQPLDMIETAASNLRNLVLHRPGPSLPEYSGINLYAANSINIWLNSAAYAGVPRLLLAAIALMLIVIAMYCLLALRRMIWRGYRTASQ